MAYNSTAWEWDMAITLAEIEAQALQLPPRERGELAHRLIVSLDEPAEDSPEAIAQAWDEEIARRVAELDAGTAELIPHEQVLAEIDGMLRKKGN
jgi:putative addiction module component (TIGR02574 family)